MTELREEIRTVVYLVGQNSKKLDDSPGPNGLICFGIIVTVRFRL